MRGGRARSSNEECAASGREFLTPATSLCANEDEHSDDPGVSLSEEEEIWVSLRVRLKFKDFLNYDFWDNRFSFLLNRTDRIIHGVLLVSL